MARIKTGGPPQKKKKVDAAAVLNAVTNTPKGIDSGMLLNSLIEQFGGAGRFAASIYSEFADAKPGSLTRTKIIEMMSRLTVVVTSQEIAKPRRAEDMTDDELKLAIGAYMKRMDGDATDPAA